MAIDLRDYFHRRCSELLVMERETWQLTSLMAQESWHTELKRDLEQYSERKRQQISNLERVVDELGGILAPPEHPVTQGMRRMHRQFTEMLPPQALVEINDALEAVKLVSLARAAYDGLVLLANQLGEESLRRLLEQNQRVDDEMHAALARLLPTLVADFGEQLRHAA